MRCQTETADGRNNTACRQRKRIFESRPHQYDECDEGSGKGHRKAPLVEVAQRTAHKGTQCCRACPWQPEAKSRADMKGVAETFVFRNARGFSFRDFLHAHGPHFVAHEKESKETFAGGKFFGVERQSAMPITMWRLLISQVVKAIKSSGGVAVQRATAANSLPPA